MPDYGYGGGGNGSPLSLYSMLYRTPGQPGYGYGQQPQQSQMFPQRAPQQVPWWAQMFWNKPDQAQDPDKKNDKTQQQQAMQMGQAGLQMLQPRQPTHTGPYPWI